MLEVARLSVYHGHHNAAITLKRGYVGHILVRQDEVENLGVFLNSGGRDRFRDNDDTPLDLPLDQNLGRTLAVL